MKPRFYWKHGQGRKTLEAVRDGQLSIGEAAEMENTSIENIYQAMRTHLGIYISQGLSRERTRIRPRRLPIETLVKEFVVQVENFAAAVIREANSDLVSQLTERDRLLEQSRREHADLKAMYDELREMAKNTDRVKTAEILRKAGVTHGE